MNKIQNQPVKALDSPYTLINSILFLVLAGMLGYFAWFPADKGHYPISSSMVVLEAEDDISTGLSRSLSELMRGRMDSARQYNQNGPRVFLFFLLQLLMRPAFVLLYMQYNRSCSWMVTDIICSTALFILTFFPFLQRFSEIAF